MKKSFVAFVACWLCTSSVWAETGPSAGLYVTSNQECAATPDKGPCAALGTICVTSASGRTIGTVARRSLAYVETGMVAGTRFDVSSSSLSGTYTAAFPTRGTQCKQDHEFPATASVGRLPSGGAFIELVVPAYRQLDTGTCALGASPRELKVRFFQTTDGTTCGNQAASSVASPADNAAPAQSARAKEAVELACSSGSLEVLVEIVEGAQGTFHGFALTDRRKGSRTIVPERTLKLAQKEIDARAEQTQLGWRSEDGKTYYLGAAAFALAACGGRPTTTNQAQIASYLEKTIRDFVDRKCKGSKECERKLKIQTSAGIRG